MRPARMSGRRLPPAVGLTVLLVLLAACAPTSSSPSPSSATSTVTMHGLAFGVAEITVPVGDVSFVNQDSVLHVIAEGENGTQVANPRITKTNIGPNTTETIRFSAAGDYHITCLVHPTMNMVVHVQ